MTVPTDNTRLYAACRAEGSDAQIDAFAALWASLYRVAYAIVASQPDADALAADCTQAALIKIHRNLDQCHTPEAFLAWATRITRRVVIDELRRPQRARQATLSDDLPAPIVSDLPPAGELHDLLHHVLAQASLSERSRRVINGRFFANQNDETLARAESAQSTSPVLPSHIQVTRAKNLAKLRSDTALLDRLREYLEC